MTTKRLALALALLLSPSVALAVPCTPLPSPSVAIAIVDPNNLVPAIMETGGLVNYRLVFSGNTTGATLPLTWEVFYQEEREVPGTRIDSGTVTVANNGTTTINQSFRVLAGTLWASLAVRVNTANPTCGDVDQRAQLPVAVSGTSMFSRAYVKPTAKVWKEYRSCFTPLWANTGGQCTPSEECWFHAQRSACLLSEDDRSAWYRLNCDLRPGMSIVETIAVGPCDVKLYQAPPVD